MTIKKENVLLFLKYIVPLCGAGIFVVGNFLATESRWTVMLFGVVCLWCSNLLYCILDTKNQYIFLLFQIAVFVFLIGRPVILTFRGESFVRYTEEANQFALWALALTLACMRVGSVVFEKLYILRKQSSLVRQDDKSKREEFRKNLEIIALIAYVITAVAMYAVALEKVFGIENYLELYTTFQSRIPYSIQMLSSMCKYALCFYLAALPKKRRATIAIVIFVGSAVLDLFVGLRNPFVLRVLFALVYFIFRNALGDNDKWIGKFEKRCIAIGIPVVIVAMGVYGTVRGYDGDMSGGYSDLKPYVHEAVFEGITDFFYDQGTSYDTLLMAYCVQDRLPNGEGKIYTLSGFHDYIVNGSIGQRLFNSSDLGSGNSKVKAYNSWNLSHAVAYANDKEEYLAGHGHGGSYLLDVYMDAGYPGIIIFSLLFGGMLTAMTYGLKKGIFLRTCILIGLLELFFAPRAEALGWMNFIIYIQFWLMAGSIYFTTALWTKKHPISEKGANK